MLTTFEQVWAQLKRELNLHDKDLDVGYKVQINNGYAIIGFLRNGKTSLTPRYYHHPSSATKAAKSYVAKHPDHKYKILVWAEPAGYI